MIWFLDLDCRTLIWKINCISLKDYLLVMFAKVQKVQEWYTVKNRFHINLLALCGRFGELKREEHTKIKSLPFSREIFCGSAAVSLDENEDEDYKAAAKRRGNWNNGPRTRLFAVSESILCPVLRHHSSFFALLVIFITAILASYSVLIDLPFFFLLSLSPTRLISVRRMEILFLVRLHR